MPVYVYECKECGQREEKLQKINDPPLKKCKECGGKLVKVFTPVGIVFKGSGFYATDSRKSSVASPKTETGTAETGTKETQTEEKPAAKEPAAAKKD